MTPVEAAAAAGLAGLAVADARDWWEQAFRDWVVELDPLDDGLVGVSATASASLDRVRWSFHGRRMVDRALAGWYDRFDGWVDGAAALLEEAGQAEATWLEVDAAMLLTGVSVPEPEDASGVLELLPETAAADGLRGWWSTSGAARLLAVHAPAGPGLAPELLVDLPGDTLDDRAVAALTLLDAVGAPHPPDDALGLALGTAGDHRLAARVALTPTGVSDAGLLLPAPDTRAVLLVAGAVGDLDEERLAAFEGALDVQEREWLELVVAGRPSTALHYLLR